MSRGALMLAGVVLVAAAAAAQTPTVPAESGRSAIDRLGDFDFQTRTDAARTVRRSDPAAILPSLLTAARTHADEYTRYRALVLAAGFAEAVSAASPISQAVGAVMQDLVRDRNDRLRTVVYQWFEYHPAPAMLPALIAALGTERSEFVRPALTRAIAAQAEDPRAAAVLLPLVLRGDDYFRGAVITALGENRAGYAVASLSDVAMLDGPLQDDAITALGRIGYPSVKAVLAKLQPVVARHVQPTVSAALCLIGIDCVQRVAFIGETLRFASAEAGFQPLLRGAVHAASVLAIAGRQEMLEALVDAGLAARDPARAALALGIGTVALRRPLSLLSLLEDRPDARDALLLLQEAFDMLAEDFDEERFYVQIRRAHWEATADSTRRRAAAALIELTEF